MNFRKSVLLLISFATIVALASCGGGSPVNATSTTLKPITVSLSGAPTTLSTGATAALTATVTNDKANAGVTWSVTCGSTAVGACGTFSNTTATTATYTAPTIAPIGQTVTVSASSVTAPDAAPSASITIMQITVKLGGVPASLATNATAALTATVANDTTNAGVTWALSCYDTATGACGALSNQTATTVTYTAPATAPIPPRVTITATSVIDPLKSASSGFPIVVLSVVLSGAPTSLGVNGTAALTATVNNDLSNAGVTWSVTCGSTATGACGALSNTTTTSATYTAPATPPASNTVTITATSIADTSISASATITIVGLTVTISGAPAFLEINGTASLTATVTNDASNAGVTWSLSCASSVSGACGALSDTTTTSATYTAPAAIPTGNSVTIKATSITDTTKSGTATTTIALPPLADGTYVYSLAGTNGNNGSPYYVAGAFTVSQGAITNGEQDYVDDSSLYLQDQNITGTQDITADGNMQIVLNTGDPAVGAQGVETINGSLISSTSASIIEFDSLVTASGKLDLQTSTTATSSGYAFYTAGIDTSLFPVAFGGVLNIDGSGTISGTGSVFDINDASYDGSVLGILQDQSFAASTVSPPDTFGRVVFSLVPSAASGVPTILLAGYVVDGTRIPLVETSGDSFLGTMGGVALSQGANTGKFTSISGNSYVAGMRGSDTFGMFQTAGLFAANSGGAVSGYVNYNDLSGIDPATAPSQLSGGTYTLDSTGRVTITGATDGIETFNLQFYLAGTGQGSEATAVSMDQDDVLGGLAWQQTGGGSFTTSSFSGPYALNTTGADLNVAEVDSVGPVRANGVWAGAVDVNSISYGQFPNAPVLGNFTANVNGVFTGTITGLDVTSCTLFGVGTGCFNDAFVYYVIDTTKVIAIETDGNQLTLGLFTLQQ